MANSDNYTNQNVAPNQIDADNLYGLQGGPQKDTDCLQGSCPSNTINMGYYIPSLQEIAAYNTSAPNIGTINPNSMQQNTSHANNQATRPQTDNNNTMMQQTNQQMSNQVIPSTPATTLDYGATMGTTMRADLGMGISDIANPKILM